MKRDDLVKNIKEFCALKEINIRDMELALEFSPGLISRWTRMSPSFDKVIKVGEYLDVSLDALVSGQSEKSRNDFVERLYKKTDEKKIEWFLCGLENPFSYPINELKELQNLKSVCSYCKYKEGFFILACALDKEEGIEDISLYLLPDKRKKPVRYEIDGDELLPLYDLIQKNVMWEEDKVGAEQLVDSFMKDGCL